MVMPLRKDFGFVHESTDERIELHQRLFANPHTMTEDSIMEASRVVPLTGSEGLRTLGEEDLFADLCMHGALHWWYRLKWLANVNALRAGASKRRIALFLPCDPLLTRANFTQRKKASSKKRRLRVSTTESTIDVTTGKLDADISAKKISLFGAYVSSRQLRTYQRTRPQRLRADFVAKVSAD